MDTREIFSNILASEMEYAILVNKGITIETAEKAISQ